MIDLFLSILQEDPNLFKRTLEKVEEVFELDQSSPYMLIVSDVKDDLRIAMTEDQKALFGIDKLKIPRSKIPAITHVDYSARVQTVDERVNPRFHRIIEQFESRTGCGVLVNTSFNVRGEPIVCSPEDAYTCFMRTAMDYLVVWPFLLDKKMQPGYVSMPNGFGVQYASTIDGERVIQGANCNEITDTADRDPFTGCPHHRYVRVRLTKIEPQTRAA